MNTPAKTRPLNGSEKVEPIHLVRFRQGKVYHNLVLAHHQSSHRSSKDSTFNLSPNLSVHSARFSPESFTRMELQSTRQGGSSYSYRRWHDTSIIYPQLRAQESIGEQQTRSKMNQNPVHWSYGSRSADVRFRRNLKCLKDKISQKIMNYKQQDSINAQQRSKNSKNRSKGGYQQLSKNPLILQNTHTYTSSAGGMIRLKDIQTMHIAGIQHESKVQEAISISKVIDTPISCTPPSDQANMHKQGQELGVKCNSITGWKRKNSHRLEAFKDLQKKTWSIRADKKYQKNKAACLTELVGAIVTDHKS